MLATRFPYGTVERLKKLAFNNLQCITKCLHASTELVHGLTNVQAKSVPRCVGRRIQASIAEGCLIGLGLMEHCGQLA